MSEFFAEVDLDDYEPDGYEWGFSADDGPVMWYCFGLPFTSFASAWHAGVKSYWETLEFYRREPGDEPQRVKTRYTVGKDSDND